MSNDEINKLADEKLAQLGKDKIAAFLESFDEDPCESESVRMTPQELGHVVTSLKACGMGVTLIPTHSPATLDEAIASMARSCAPNPEEATEIAAQLKAATHTKAWADAKQKIDGALAKLSAQYEVEPDPFSAAIAALESEKRRADNRGISRDPIALMPLVGELLQIPTYISVDVDLRFRDGHVDTSKAFGWTMPIVTSKKRLVNALSGFIMANAALAKDLGSSALMDWKRAINQMWELLYIDGQGDFVEHTVRQAWPKKAIATLFKTIEEARRETFADGMINAYLTNGKEVM